MEKHPRPHNRTDLGEGFKLHLRVVRAGQRELRLITLRPDTDVAFAVNYFHDTWHIIGTKQGSNLLARLLWGLAFQKQPGTVILLQPPHIVPTPFEAEPSPPVLLAPSHLTPLDEATCQALKAKLSRLGPSQKTIRWQTWGLEALRSDPPRWGDPFLLRSQDPLYAKERMRFMGGFVVYTAPPAVLRKQAFYLMRLQLWDRGFGIPVSGDHYLAEERGRRWHPEGEVQIFRDFSQMRSDAMVAR